MAAAPDYTPQTAPVAVSNPLQTTIRTRADTGTIRVPVGDRSLTTAPKMPDAPSNPGNGVNPPGTMAGRMGGDLRRRTMEANKMKPRSEETVLSGLRWLKANQNPDGSWSREFQPAMTGLALLCFLGHGELQNSPDFGSTVRSAIDWVLARGTEFQGRMSLTRNGWGGNDGVYQHGILTYAIAEYFTMTRDERFEPLLRQAIGYIVAGQNPLGGWDYGFAKGPRNDLSVTGWQIQALKAAHLSGLGIDGVDAALDKSMSFLKRWQGPEGGFGYDKPGDRASLAGVGVLCTYFWRAEKDRAVRDGIEYLLGKTEVKYRSATADLYAWYYSTQACLMFGEPAWSKWNRRFQDEVVAAQSPDGSWPPTRGGAGELQKKLSGAGPVYRTAMCVLMLETFYRYIPTNR
jgi:hypothetical protein